MDTIDWIMVFIVAAMIIAWLAHIAICWHWDFHAWWHDSDNDI